MKAILVKAHGSPNTLIYETHSLAKPASDQVLISVKYAGVNFADTLIIRGKYQFQPDLPFSPGGEVSGQVIGVGKAVKDFALGDRVVCGTSWGGFSEEALGLASNTFKLSDNVSLSSAAAMLMTYATAYHALIDRANIQKGETLVVLGASGGVGSATMQLGKWLGVKVIAFTSSKEKFAYCLSMGANHVELLNLQTLKTTIKKITTQGAQVIIDNIGGHFTEQAFRSIAPFGRHLLIGFASGSIPSIPCNLPLLKSASLMGVFWGYFFRNYSVKNRKNISILLKLLEQNIINPNVCRIFPLKEASIALQHVETKQVKGKILLDTGKNLT